MSTLLETTKVSLGLKGGYRVTGSSVTTGSFSAIKANSEITFGGGNVCNITNMSGLTLSAGDIVLGEFTTVDIAGDAILYKYNIL